MKRFIDWISSRLWGSNPAVQKTHEQAIVDKYLPMIKTAAINAVVKGAAGHEGLAGGAANIVAGIAADKIGGLTITI